MTNGCSLAGIFILLTTEIAMNGDTLLKMFHLLDKWQFNLIHAITFTEDIKWIIIPLYEWICGVLAVNFFFSSLVSPVPVAVNLFSLPLQAIFTVFMERAREEAEVWTCKWFLICFSKRIDVRLQRWWKLICFRSDDGDTHTHRDEERRADVKRQVNG